MNHEVTVGYSSCPNDTFIFYALINGIIETEGLCLRPRIADVEELNKQALASAIDITKISIAAYPSVSDNYILLRSGGAMGRGCGPLLVAQENLHPRHLKGMRIAIPGELTTAYLLLRLFDPDLGLNTKVMRFDKIMPAVRDNLVDAGLIIHESRFTYHAYGLREILDLGRWWEEKTSLPLPLGAIVAKRMLGKTLIKKAESLIRESVLYALRHRKEPLPYIRQYAQELDDSVIDAHIALYVNDYSVLADEEAIKKLFEMAQCAGLMPEVKEPIFID